MFSQPELIQRNAAQDTKLEEDIQTVINQIHFLSSQDENTRSFSSTDSFYLNGYFGVLNNLYTVFQPLLREGFIDDLPKTLVCLLSGRQDCGLEAELTKTVSLELVKPLLSFVSSMRSQTCTPLNGDAQSNSFFESFLRMGETTATTSSGFLQTLLNILSSIPLSGNLMDAVRNLMDSAVTNFTNFMATLLQVPMDYINIALQFGIKTPSLDGKETCEEGKTLLFYLYENLNSAIMFFFSELYCKI